MPSRSLLPVRICLPLLIGPSLIAQVRTLLPHGFEPNRGQESGRFDYVSYGRNHLLKLNAVGADLQLVSDSGISSHFQLTIVGANRGAAHKELDPLSGKSNYIIGNSPSLWKRDVPQYARVRYHDVYPGIDVEYHREHGNLEYDFVLAAGAD